MYECNRKLLFGLLTLLGVSTLAEKIYLGFIVARSHNIHLPLPGCFLLNTQKFAFTYWFPMITFESTLFILAIIKSVRQAMKDTTTPHLMFILLRDSIVYFGGMLAVVLANCIVWAAGRESLFVAFTSTYISIQSILSCRMLLNVRSAANPWYHYETSIFSSVRFIGRSGPPESDEMGASNQSEIGRGDA
ncbi:hypothetical protein QCA50_010722 [Cerrena zonata]|uniref:Uncharacterized protein n=1 Tax=Cerrena zonata TaxID=2478898 RepID=A0AAW0GA46_9APHY